MDPDKTSSRPPPIYTGRILVVDDNQINRMKLVHGIQKLGHAVTQAEDGRLALELLRNQDVDLLLLDILMPEVDGYEVLAEIKADPRLRQTPVLVISAVEEMESIVRCIEMGAEDYLTRPVDPVLLNARIGALLEKKKLRDQEVEYLQQVQKLTEAAAAVEAGEFDPEQLAGLTGRQDALGQLARVFLRMTNELQAREQTLAKQVQQLRIELDAALQASQVSEITETPYFQELQSKSQDLRKIVKGEKTEED